MEDPLSLYFFFNSPFFLEVSTLTISIELGVIALLLFCSAMISGSEISYFSLTSQQIAALQNSDKYADGLILRMLSKPRMLLATILILNNLVNVSIVAVSTFLTWQTVGNQGLIILFLTLSVTFLIVFFGEVLPKVIASSKNVQFARFTTPGMWIAYNVVSPLAWILTTMGSVIENRIKSKGYKVSAEELTTAVEIAGQETSENQKDILRNIVNFGTITARQIMKSRMDITAFDIEMSFAELVEQIKQLSYSRIPVYKETIDHIEGVIYVKDLIPYLHEADDFRWQDFIRRDTFFVHENKKIDTLFRDFQKKRVHMAVVVDEYGGTCGLVTLEDIIEEVVGEINDEFDGEEVDYKKLDANTYIFESKTSINDFCKVIDVDPEVFEEAKGDSESMGGLLLELFARIPKQGEIIDFQNYSFTVTQVDKKRIKQIKVQIKEVSSPAVKQ